MDSLTFIFTMCSVMWYLIDNLKENFWAGLPHSNYITIAVSAVTSLLFAFGYKLDLVYALDLVGQMTVLGKVITALTMMGGSALVSEVIEMFRKKI